MSRYEPLGDILNNQRLGSFERSRSFGAFGTNGDFQTDFSTKSDASSSDTAAVLTGVGQVLTPLLGLGVGIFKITQQQKLEKERLKAQARAGGGLSPEIMAALAATQQPQVQKSKAPLIIAILGGMTLVAAILIIALKKK